MRLLLAEGEPQAGNRLVKALDENGFIVDWVRTDLDALHSVAACTYDLIVLSAGLPGMDRWSVLREIRKRQPAPVLFLTTRDRIEDVDGVRDLEVGADDCLVKPFALSEFIARVRALMRRSEDPYSDILRMSDLEVHLQRRRVERGGRRVDVTEREYALLLLLMRRRGEVLPRKVLAEQIWNMSFDSDTDMVDVAVRRLRGKVDEPFPRKLIHTVRGVGYVMEDRGP